jgi:GDP-4-dehydro-6-deoxy-D-mannose reductase
MTQFKKALITGSNGFVGQWLARLLIDSGYRVLCTDLQENSRLPDSGCSYRQLDITATAAVNSVISEYQPDAIFHLAGVSYLPQADHSPKQSIDINISGTMSVLDAVKNGSPTSTLLLIGSSKEYDSSLHSEGISENTLPRPTNFYGITKYTGELIGLQYARQFGIDVRCTRSFNHTGPGQSPNFVCSDWARQAAEITLGRAEPVITVGEIGSTIDFSDVRDVITAYRAIIENGRPGTVYNVCNGTGVSLSWILDYLCSKVDITVSVHYTEEKKRAHKTNSKMIGNHARLTSHTGWKPVIPFQQTLDDLYEWWVGRMKEEGEARIRNGS